MIATLKEISCIDDIVVMGMYQTENGTTVHLLARNEDVQQQICSSLGRSKRVSHVRELIITKDAKIFVDLCDFETIGTVYNDDYGVYFADKYTRMASIITRRNGSMWNSPRTVVRCYHELRENTYSYLKMRYRLEKYRPGFKMRGLEFKKHKDSYLYLCDSQTEQHEEIYDVVCSFLYGLSVMIHKDKKEDAGWDQKSGRWVG